MFFRLWTPDFAQDLAMGEDAAGVPNEQSQKRVFGGGQFHFVTSAGDHARGKIDN